MPHDRAALLHNEASPAWDVLDIASCGACDRHAADRGVAGTVLMEAAGAAVARAIIDTWSPRRVAVLCGPGNNGGDGFVCARYLAAAGWPVRVMLLGDVAALTGDAAWAARQWGGGVDALMDGRLDDADLVVDALFGAGLTRPLGGDLMERVGALRRSSIPCVAIDLPSGWNGDQGRCEGAAMTAELTVSFHRPKPAHLLEPAASACGEIRIADIGIPSSWSEQITPVGRLNTPDLWSAHLPGRDAGSHKHALGRLVVFSGGAKSTGAARLAAEAGLRMGAGLVTLASPPGALMVNAAALKAVMLARWEDAQSTAGLLAERRASAAVLGPALGVGESTCEAVRQAAVHEAPMVLDADALGSFSGQSEALAEHLRPIDVLTPHVGEFERLFPGLLASAINKIEAVRAAAAQLGCTILLKGADTIIAAPGRTPVINRHASPDLATAGSGDVLAGMIGGLLAMGMPGFEASCAACWLHGDIARNAGAGLSADDMAALLPARRQALDRRLHRELALKRLTSR
jgi:hydroxyethylthiazole kinase-like uncharacterized protein yjeF